MIFDLQKASVWKRVSAWLFDGIILGIVIVGIAFTMSSILGYDGYSRTLDESYDRYEKEYGITFQLTEDDYNRLTPEQQRAYTEAYDALTDDDAAMHAYTMLVNLSLVITSISVLLGYLILEFAVPLLFGNGQTLGKKIFGIAVMRTDSVKINTVQLFVRTILGKYTIETMVPVLVVMLIFFGTLGLMGTLIVAALALTQIVLMAATRTNSLLHDVLANTVVVDIASQMIFDTEEAMLDYKKKIHAEMAARASY